MAADFRRADRVAEAIREEVAVFLREEAKDPRITGFVTVTGVEATRDLKHASVFVSIMGTDAEKKATLEGLASLAGHLRSRLGKSLRLSGAPTLNFKIDESVARAARIESLLATIRKDDDAAAPPAGDAPPEGNGGQAD
ncbi:MAG: 30S ribosome-binding factor RbfA [Gemmatimonadaceae bacterium]|nr:30S ribosome-binding factor RbfA [Gemmatimonadaceae bacterium]